MDNAALRAQAVTALQAAGYEVLDAAGLEDALERLPDFTPDLLVLSLTGSGRRLLGVRPRIEALREAALLVLAEGEVTDPGMPHDAEVLLGPLDPAALEDGARRSLLRRGDATASHSLTSLTASDDQEADDELAADDEILPTSEISLPPLRHEDRDAPERDQEHVDWAPVDVTAPRINTLSLGGIREQAAAVVHDREARSAAAINREARSAAVINREARSAAVINREARSAAVIDQEAHPAAAPSAVPGRATSAAPSRAPNALIDPQGEVVLEGRLEQVPPTEILALLGRQEHTGVLVLYAGEATELRIVLHQGRVAQATATGLGHLRIGRFVIEHDGPSEEEIEALCSSPASSPARGPAARLLGQLLCDVGHLSREERRRALLRQTEEVFFEALRTGAGRFRFFHVTARDQLPQAAVDPALGAAFSLEIGTLLLEGHRRRQDLFVLEHEIATGACYLRIEHEVEQLPQELGLTEGEQQVLERCNGRHGLEDIARDSRLAPLQVTRILRRLQSLELVRKRLPPQVV